ncbi:MAG TPA: ABC transporter permease [Candidatus Acidoferrum sp.]|nr:ABC transporter permease [Candidatus Acidoferrum sp.]
MQAWLRQIWLRINALWKRSQLDRDIQDELEFHLSMREGENRATGLEATEARHAARRRFGNVSRVRESSREQWVFVSLETLWQDLRFGARTLWKNAGFSAIAIITLSLGITANVTVFSFVDALFLRHVPAKDPAGLVRIYAPAGQGGTDFSYPEFSYLRDHTKTLETLAAHYSTAPLFINANGESGEVQGAVVSSNYFPMLGLSPQLGRFFSRDEDSVPGRDAVAVIGYGLWQRIFGTNPAVLGKTLLINSTPFAIIGVAPEKFAGVNIGGSPNEIWIPSMMSRVGYRWCDAFKPDCTFLELMGRLAPGRSTQEAQAELGTLVRQLQTVGGGFDERTAVSVTPAVGISEQSRHYFLLLTRLLTAVAGILLLVVCANVGGLLVARGAARNAEIAMRRALGASVSRISSLLLAENLLLAGCGGALAVVFSLWTSTWLAGFYSIDSEGYRRLFDVRMDPRVVGYSVVVTLLSALLFAVPPIWQANRADLIEALKSGGSLRGFIRTRTRMALVTLQVALSVALVVGAGLLARSTVKLMAGRNMDLHHVLGLRLRPRLIGYAPEKSQAFLREVVDRLHSLPGIQAVSLMNTSGSVWGNGGGIKWALPVKISVKPQDQSETPVHEIAPDYFATLRIPFVAGRDFTQFDLPGSPRVTIVNETLAHKISPQNPPIHKFVIFGGRPYQIVGIVKDAQVRSALDPPISMAYLPFWQNDTEPQTDARFCVRVSGDPLAMMPAIRQAISAADSNVPITETMPLLEQVRGEYTDARLASAVLACAAVLALVLSAIGLFGVIAYEVGQRSHEIGIRLALGAMPRQVVALFLNKGLAVVCAGCAAGLILSFATSHLLSAWLFSVGPYDPATFAVAALILAAVSLFASYLPSKRATQVDPVQALRHE